MTIANLCVCAGLSQTTWNHSSTNNFANIEIYYSEIAEGIDSNPSKKMTSCLFCVILNKIFLYIDYKTCPAFSSMVAPSTIREFKQAIENISESVQWQRNRGPVVPNEIAECISDALTRLLQSFTIANTKNLLQGNPMQVRGILLQCINSIDALESIPDRTLYINIRKLMNITDELALTESLDSSIRRNNGRLSLRHLNRTSACCLAIIGILVLLGVVVLLSPAFFDLEKHARAEVERSGYLPSQYESAIELKHVMETILGQGGSHGGSQRILLYENSPQLGMALDRDGKISPRFMKDNDEIMQCPDLPNAPLFRELRETSRNAHLMMCRNTYSNDEYCASVSKMTCRDEGIMLSGAIQWIENMGLNDFTKKPTHESLNNVANYKTLAAAAGVAAVATDPTGALAKLKYTFSYLIGFANTIVKNRDLFAKVLDSM